jgi:hypothetical protein
MLRRVTIPTPEGEGARMPIAGRRTRYVVAAAVVLVVLLVAAGAAIQFATQLGSRGTTASVNGLRYDVGVGRSLQVTDADLTPYGAVSSYTDAGAYPFADDAAYALRGVDPKLAVVVRWAPGLRDDAGPWGEFALLTRALTGEMPGLCAYFDPKSEASPPECP